MKPSPPNTVAFCATCLVDQFLPAVGVASVKVLRRAGYQVAFPAAQTCCGQPFFNSGFQAEAARLARRTIEIFEPYPAVVVPGGSCAAMIKVEYPRLLAGEPLWQRRAEALSAKTFELSAFLVQQAGWLPPSPPDQARPAVTYHDSCHMCRLLDLRREPRAALRAAGYPLDEMEESDRCCGFGGLFSLKMPEVSQAITGQKLAQAGQSGAVFLATADPGCLLQMQAQARPGGPQPVHIATLLEEATRP